MPANLLVLGQLQDFDVVLGMDWLARYYATIDCGARTVTFREPGQEEFTFKGCGSTLFATWISSARVRQLISRGCIAFLATVVEVPTAASGLEDIPIVQPVYKLDMCGESRLSQGLDDGLARRVSHRLVILGCVCDWTDEDVRALTGGACDTPIIPHRMGMGLSLGL
uniref:Reverse transcriptase domain-containing protein n=1 Tax=Ananas comosus var. bracteatus TaxID=296719 RepID=A0A6V7QM94_ANACO|nr:unnamed protein product [Ananas comosus var. bracteatus]